VRVLLLAQGSGSRWDTDGQPYLGRPKHFVKVDDEVLLFRTVRQLTERGVTPVVIGPDNRYAVPGAELVTLAQPDPVRCDMSKFIATRPHWSDEEPTALMWADCFYTDAAVNRILDPPDELHYFRPRFYWEWPQVANVHIRNHYAAALGLKYHALDNPDLLITTPHQTVVDDWTDDFDTPTEYEEWTARRADACEW
jgi:choline kinase